MSEWLDIKEKTIVVTGGGSGIGKHIVQELQRHKANVIVADLNVDTEDKNGIYYIKTDITSLSDICKMIKLTEKKFGKIDVLVNNAGVNLPRLLVDVYSDEEQYEIDEKSFKTMTDVNQKGMVFTTQSVVKNMLKNKLEGTIINISSESGMEGSVGQPGFPKFITR
ncbi:SDR family NAD(P)-dependent oxidoreductase [Amphibacillus sp. Q70]|uniref:SDR family NAD(P)-dependent oxidoreductase n=1 Tax=Amphibacillus sp. Q70 TaxID=3453416 RepID=UPI003F82E590